LLLGGSTLIVGVMVYDDVLGMPAWLKLLAQAAVAALVVAPRLRGPLHGIVIDSFNLPGAGQVTLPLALAMLFTVFWIVGMMNTLNWLDGMDGLAGSVTLVACAVLFAHTYFWPRHSPQFTISILPLALGAAVIGFLPFNWHPARIILGDAGANFLGFALAVLSIIGGAKIATALLALGLPVLDVAWVISFRMAHGRSPLRADRGHLHHRLLDRGWGQPRIVAFVAGVSVVFGVLALVLPSRGAKLGAMMALGFVLLSTVWGLALRDRTEGDGGAEGDAD
jgi:UDP-N-acetylmuramyl pentapeptide phosphotransferase/UDP-N-acetylglucosamine-1-phosphate transferase